jgi:NCAIR mutase (PurE)-related protein
MNAEMLRGVLTLLEAGQVTIDEAVARLQTPPVAELGFARVDLDRKARCGFPEVIFGEGKTPEWVEGVIRKLIEADQDCLATRLDAEQIRYLSRHFPEAEIDSLGRTFWLARSERTKSGTVCVVTAGTGDLPVAREALNTASALGANAELVVDVGVAGLHRLLAQRERLASADAIVVVAGMDGALPSVVGGLVDCPVIAVPTSIGYGTAFRGVAPLLTMLNACSANVVVVNIDAGFKAGYVAAMIARRSPK